MPQIGQIDYFLTQIFWLVLVFTSIYLFAANFFLPKIGKIIEGRKSKIKQDIDMAEKMVEQQKQLKIMTDKMLDEARGKASEMKKKIQKESEVWMQDKLVEMDKSLAKEIAKEEGRLARYKGQLEKEIPAIASKLKQEIYAVLFAAKKTKFKN